MDENATITHVYAKDLTDNQISAIANLMKMMDEDMQRVYFIQFTLQQEVMDIQTYQYLLEQMKMDMRDTGLLAGFFLQTLEGKYIGFIHYDMCSSFKNTIHIKDVYIDREHRRQGYGRRLLQTAQTQMKEIHKITKFEQDVAVGNDSAFKLYRDLGFNKTIQYTLLRN